MKEHAWHRVVTVTEPEGSIWKCHDCSLSVWSILCPTVSSFLDEEPNVVRYTRIGDLITETACCTIPVDCQEAIAMGVIEG